MTEQEYVLLRSAICDVEAVAKGSYGRLKGKQRQVLTEVVEDLRTLQRLLQAPDVQSPQGKALEEMRAATAERLCRL